MKSKITMWVLPVFSMLFSTAAGAQDQAKAISKQALGWQLESFLPSNMSPAVSWDCFDFPQQASDFAKEYVQLLYGQDGCKISDQVTRADGSISLSVSCPYTTREIEFKKTSDSRIGVNETEIDGSGSNNQYLSLFKQCDASVEFDCSAHGQASWHAAHPAEAVNYSCEERDPQSDEPPEVKSKPDFGFPVKMKHFKVIRGRPGEEVDNGLPEQCNWFEVDGEEFCYSPTALEQFVDNPHALSLANIVIEITVDEKEFSGNAEYCDDVNALAEQMPWKKGIKCEVTTE